MVGFGWIGLDLVGFGIWLVSVGCGSMWLDCLDLVGDGWIGLDLIGFGWFGLDVVSFGWFGLDLVGFIWCWLDLDLIKFSDI